MRITKRFNKSVDITYYVRIEVYHKMGIDMIYFNCEFGKIDYTKLRRGYKDV